MRALRGIAEWPVRRSRRANVGRSTLSGSRLPASAWSALAAVLAAARRALVGSAPDAAARAEWCRSQRERLGLAGGAVVWVHRDAVAWAEWGAGQGYFLLERMDGLAYLRATGE